MFVDVFVTEKQYGSCFISCLQYGDGCWDSDNGIFIKLLNDRSYAHLHAVFAEYKTVAGGEDILHAMKKDSPKDFYKILSTIGMYLLLYICRYFLISGIFHCLMSHFLQSINKD
jgi:hypothetical protein